MSKERTKLTSSSLLTSVLYVMVQSFPLSDSEVPSPSSEVVAADPGTKGNMIAFRTDDDAESRGMLKLEVGRRSNG